MPGPEIVQRIGEMIPRGFAWPLSVLSTATAIGGAALMFHAAAFGRPVSAIWAGVAFVIASALWYASDLAASNRS